MFSVEKPVVRSKFRRTLGKEYFCLKQRMFWTFGRDRFATLKSGAELPYEVMRHQSVLLRKLKDVDMQLQHNKTTNLRLAADKIHGIVLKPGETFSFWRLVGRPTAAKGYLTGLTLSNGKIGTGVGGGLCQMGNLIYWMALHTPLTVVKRWRHSYDVFPDNNRLLPFGSGATLSYNYIDLQLRNDTDQLFQLNIWLSDKNLHGAICTDRSLNKVYKVYEKEHRFELQWWGGYTRHNQIWRKILDADSGETADELVTENHAIMMYNPLIESSSHT